MKPIAHQYDKNYPPLRVYRDDLERIVAIVKGNCYHVTIHADDYELSDVSDLDRLRDKQHLDTLSRFNVTGVFVEADSFEPAFLEVLLQTGSAPHVTLSDSSKTKLAGAMMQVDTILSARHSSTFDMLTSRTAVVVGMLFCLVVAGLSWLRPWNPTPQLPSLGAMPWLVVIVAAVLLALALPRIAARVRAAWYVTIYLTDSHAQKRLTREQRRQFINGSVGFALGVLSTVISGLIVWALTR